MPFFTGAYNFEIHSARMIDRSGSTYIGGNDYVGGHQFNMSNFNAGSTNIGGDQTAVSNRSHFGSRNAVSDRDPTDNGPAAGAHASVDGNQIRGTHYEGVHNLGSDYAAAENQVPHQRLQLVIPASPGTLSKTDSHSLDPEQQEKKERRPLTGLTSFSYNLYTFFLLRIPTIYLSRIQRLGDQAELAQRDIIAMAATADWANPSSDKSPEESRNGKAFLEYVSELENNVRRTGDSPDLPVSFLSLGTKWKDFVDRLLHEWQTLNIVSVLLIPGILATLNTFGTNNNPVTRYLAFWSLISALLSLLYGCVFIMQFSQMKKTIVGIELLEETFREDNISFWAVDIMLALPSVWLAWSILGYLACVVAFLWQAGSNPPVEFIIPNSMVLGFRIFISAVLGVGAMYTFLIFYTLKRYGRDLDALFTKQLDHVIAVARNGAPPQIAVTLPEV